MVAALLRLRFRVLANTLRRSPVLLVATVLGMIQAVLIMAVVLLGTILLADAGTPASMRDLIPVIAGSVVLLGWTVLPLAVAGGEATLEARKLAVFPLAPGTIMRAKLLIGVLWTPGIATLVCLVMSSAIWWRVPLAVLGSLLMAPVLLALCIVTSRAASQFVGNLIARRGALARVLGIAGLVALLVGPSFVAVRLAVSSVPRPHSGEEDLRVPAVAEYLGYTPLGAPFSIPSHLANARWEQLGIAALITGGFVLVALAVWRRSLAVALHSGGGTAQRGRRRGLGVVGWVPATPAGAIAARSLVSWVRDPRYCRQLVVLPALPTLLTVFALVSGLPGFAYAAAPTVAALLPLSQFAAISYDGTAFASQLAAPVPGIADRVGRSIAMLVIVVPAIVLIAVVSLAVVGAPMSRLPAVLGLSIGSLLAALSVSAVSSAFVIVSVPAIGRNPFGAAAGAGMTQILGSYAVTLVAGIVTIPVLILGVLCFVTGASALAWATLAAGVVWGSALLALGILLGGRLLDRNGPALLSRVARVRET